MSLLSKVQKGVQKTSYMSVLYGAAGSGKTTFISKIPGMLVLDIESGSKLVDTTRLTADVIPDYQTLVATVEEFINDKHDYKALAIDSITSLEHYINKSVCVENNVKEIGDIPFGRGVAMGKEKLKDFIVLLKRVQEKGYEVWLVGHAQVKKFSDPTLLQQFDRYTIQASEGFGQEIIRQSDNTYFVKHKVDVAVDKNTKKAKGIGGDDITMFTRFTAAFDAKTRLNLPAELPFEYEDYAQAVALNAPRPAADLIADIQALVTKLKPHDPTTAQLALEKLEAAKSDNSKLQIIKNKLIESTKNF